MTGKTGPPPEPKWSQCVEDAWDYVKSPITDLNRIEYEIVDRLTGIKYEIDLLEYKEQCELTDEEKDKMVQAAREGLAHNASKMNILYEVLGYLYAKGLLKDLPDTKPISQFCVKQQVNGHASCGRDHCGFFTTCPHLIKRIDILTKIKRERAAWEWADPERVGKTEFAYIQKIVRGVSKPTDIVDYNKNAKAFVSRHPIVYDMIGEDIDAKPIYWIYEHGRYVLWDDPHTSFNRMFVGRDGQVLTSHQCNELLKQVRVISPRIGKGVQWAELSDTNKHFWNCPNHILVLERGKDPQVIPHDPEIRTTHQLEIEHDPDAPEPTIFETYLDKVTEGDAFMRRAILECLTLCITARRPHPLKRRAYLIVGMRGAGKSGLQRIVDNFLPRKLCGAYTLESFGNRYGDAKLDGISHKFTSMSGENANKVLAAPEMIKTMVFGEPTMIDQKYKPKFTMYAPNIIFVFFANKMPRLPLGDYGAILRRLSTILFKKEFEDPNVELDDKMIATELPGIMNILIQTHQDMIEHGGPIAVRDVLDELNMYHEARLRHDEINQYLVYGIDESCTIADINLLVKIHCSQYNIDVDKSEYREYFESRGCKDSRIADTRMLDGVSINAAGLNLLGKERSSIPDRGLKDTDTGGVT